MAPIRGITNSIDGFITSVRSGLFGGSITMDQVAAAARTPRVNLRISRQARELSGNSKPWMLWDLDETLTYARPEKANLLPGAYQRGDSPVIRDWRPWQRSLEGDIPEPEMASLFRGHLEGGTHNVGILTARSERTRPITEKWLQRNELMPDLLIMRPISKELENAGSGPYKLNMLDRVLPKARVDRFYDDSKSVIDAMESRGIASVHVTPKEADSQARMLAAQQVAAGRARSVGGRGFGKPPQTVGFGNGALI